MALHHKLCHVLGGSFDLRHAEVRMIVLPHATAYNRAAAPAAMTSPPTSPPGRAWPSSACVADLAMQSPYPNPSPLTRDRITVLLDGAFPGPKLSP